MTERADDQKDGGKDRTRIDIHDDHDLRYWSRKFDVSRADVRRAVEKVGVLADDVGRELASRPRRKPAR
jgi:hypothetical protein